jgi:ketosteroid isomerase-like protein
MTIDAFGLVLMLWQTAGSVPPNCQVGSPIVRKIAAVAEGLIAADNARALERVRSFYADNAVLMPPNEDPLSSWPLIRPRYEALFEAFNPSIEVHIEETCVSGAQAFVRGHNGGRLQARDGGQSRVLNDEYLMVLRLDPDRQWRITHLMWHAAAPAR